MLKGPRHARNKFAKKCFFNGQNTEKIQPPSKKIPRRAVPKARERPGDEQVAIGAKSPSTIAPERDIHVLPKPGGQSDMKELNYLEDSVLLLQFYC